MSAERRSFLRTWCNITIGIYLTIAVGCWFAKYDHGAVMHLVGAVVALSLRPDRAA